MTPTSRGFDSFLGTWHCCTDHYQHTFPPAASLAALDLVRSRHRDGPVVADFDSVGQYSTLLYANESARIIRAHDRSKGLYLYLAFQAVHGPYQVPLTYAARYDAAHPDRHVFEGMVTAVDAALAEVIQASRAAHLWDRTLVVFHSDNGGNVPGNRPFRGGKFACGRAAFGSSRSWAGQSSTARLVSGDAAGVVWVTCLTCCPRF